MEKEFEFQVYEDSVNDCLKVYQTEKIELINSDYLKSLNYIGCYMSEKNGTCIRRGLTWAVKNSAKKRALILLYFTVDNKDSYRQLPPIVDFSDLTTKTSIVSKVIHFIKCSACKKKLWFILLEKTTLYHLILAILFSVNFYKDYPQTNSFINEECIRQCDNFIYAIKYKFLALIVWWSVYLYCSIKIYNHFIH